MNFIPSKDHIPSFSDRVRTGRPILLRSGQVLVFWGVFDFVLKLVNRVLDLFGKGESLIDLYRTLPEVLKILENPIVGAAAIIFGFGALWHQGRTLGVNSRSAVVLFDPHHRPVSGPRTTPALKRALWTSMFAVALAAVIWTALETPVRDLLFLRKLTVQITPPSVANPRYHSETHRSALASPLNPNSPRALVRPPTVETRPEPAPMVSAQPISATTHQQTPQYPSAYQEVRAAILAVKTFNEATWQSGFIEATRQRDSGGGHVFPSLPIIVDRTARFDDSVTLQWRNDIEPQVRKAREDAMQQLPPSTINQARKDDDAFRAAMASAGTGISLNNDTVDTYGTVIITQDQINRVKKQIRAA